MEVALILNWYSLMIAVALLFYFFTKKQLNYFESRNIKYHPYFPFVGNMNKVLMQKEHFKDVVSKIYNAFPEEKYVGLMRLNKPIIMIRDLHMLKKIAIKDFDHFMNHQGILNEEADPLFGNNLFVLKWQKWRDMRATLSPAFTTSKMRQMFEFITETGQQMADYCRERFEEPEFKERGLLEIEMKDAFTRYTNDVIATTAFGVKINSLNDQNNQFYKMAKKATDFSGLRNLKLISFFLVPKLMKILGIKLFEKEEHDFFFGLVTSTMKLREENGIIRNDMIQLLIEAKNGRLQGSTSEENDNSFAVVKESEVGKQIVKRKWTDYEIVAQAMLFFIAGFETTSTLLCFASHALTVHPEIQKKLQEEVDEVLESNNQLTYNAITSMKYLDMVVAETLRMWPPVVLTDRQCTSSYNLPPSSNSHSGYTIQKNEVIGIPIYGFHHDPKYFPQPEVFDPKRYSDENKASIDPMSYMPFGIGPRNCIGSRFALLEAKTVLFHLLAKFDFVETAKTSNPIQLSTDTINVTSKTGFWIGLKPRDLK